MALYRRVTDRFGGRASETLSEGPTMTRAHRSLRRSLTTDVVQLQRWFRVPCAVLCSEQQRAQYPIHLAQGASVRVQL